MKKIAASLVFIWLLALTSLSCIFASEVIWQDISGGHTRLETALVDPQDSRLIYAGSQNSILKSEDGGLNWRSVLTIPGQNKRVNSLWFDPQNKNSLYAATGNGLYFSPGQGGSWKRIFQGKNYREREGTALAILPYAMYLGTKSGLFVSQDKGRSWQKERGIMGKGRILAIAYNSGEPDCVYVASVDGVFKTKDQGQNWERIFVAQASEDDSDTEEQSEDSEEEGRVSKIRYLVVNPHNPRHLYLATSEGLYQSPDEGKTWQRFTGFGLLSEDIRFILVSAESRLYAATKSGVFAYRGERWQELSLGLIAEEIRSLSIDNQENLYAASDKGLFKAEMKYFTSGNQEDILAPYYKDEPKISQVQQAAVKYAEVEPEKISRWRKQAAKRALLPKVTIDMDRDRDRTTSGSIWGTYSSNGIPGRYFVGPDDVTKYNNKNWGVSLTWELGDLVFSDDQTNIDVRSRLMVQLRDDILDEVTKIYFERLRVKMELDSLSIEDRKKRYEKELRLQELSASLDALTGGYFSQAAKKKEEE